ncbi:MAG: serine phosphatase RsbU (regulator of sigma subunit), partial [Parvicellaceae bacterium]
GNKKGIARCLNNIGLIYSNQGDIPNALTYYHKSLTLLEEIGYKKGIATTLSNLGGLELQQGELTQAKSHAIRSMELAKELGFPNLIKRSARLLSKVTRKEGNFREALEMYELQILMRDSINNEETQKATIRQQTKYEFEKAQAIKDVATAKDLEVLVERERKQKIITYSATAGLVLVIAFLVFVFNRLKVTRKQKSLIEEKKEELEKIHDELHEKNTEIVDSIAYAKRIQLAILPPHTMLDNHLRNGFVLFKPKDVVSGDFYWMEVVGNKVIYAAADCTGHGVPGAMVSVVCNNALNRTVREFGITQPAQILNKTRELVIETFQRSEQDVKDGMDIAICSLEGNKLKYAGANNPLWIIRNGAIIETKANKQPIGQFDNPEPYTTHNFDLEPGDSIYIFSDGYVDQFGGEKGKKFKSKAFKELLLSIQDKSMEEQNTIIDEVFETWKGKFEQIDDVCIIGVRI